MPALRWTSHLENQADAARRLGWTPFPGPAAINSEPYAGRSGCGYHGFCNSDGCHLDAKNSTLVSTIPKAMDTGNLKIVTRAHAAGAKVILVGDNHQIPEIAAGGGFRAALDALGHRACELTINRRQHHQLHTASRGSTVEAYPAAALVSCIQLS